MSKQKIARLKKGPDINDYVVQVIDRTDGERITYKYFKMRSDARSYAKLQHAGSSVRVRVFHIRFDLVYDSK